MEGHASSFCEVRRGVSTSEMQSLDELVLTAGDVSFEVELGYPAASQIDGLRSAGLPGVVLGVMNLSVADTTGAVLVRAPQRHSELTTSCTLAVSRARSASDRNSRSPRSLQHSSETSSAWARSARFHRPCWR